MLDGFRAAPQSPPQVGEELVFVDILNTVAVTIFTTIFVHPKSVVKYDGEHAAQCDRILNLCSYSP